MPLFLLYFIILTNLYCAETINIVLSFVIDVHFVMVLLLVFSRIWLFPYPFRFCNPVRIYGRKINDDDDVWCEPSAAATIIAALFLNFETIQSGTSIPTSPKNLLPPTITIYIPYSSADPFCDTQGIYGGYFRRCKTDEAWSWHFTLDLVLRLRLSTPLLPFCLYAFVA